VKLTIIIIIVIIIIIIIVYLISVNLQFLKLITD
jgi:hypothetical protein